MDKKRGQTDWTSVVKGAAVGAGGSILMTLALTALAAGLVVRETIDETSLDTVTAGILILSSICGSLLAASATGHHRLPVCMASGALYFLLLIACAILMYDGANGAVGVTALLVLGGSGAAALLGLKEGRKGRGHRTYKNRNWKVVQNSQRGN